MTPITADQTASPDLQPADAMLRPRDAAAEMGIATSTLWKRVRTGRLPQPYYVGERQPRWRRSELRAALAACRREPLPRT